MAAPFTRDLSITYAGVTLGGSDEFNLLFDRHRVFGSYDEIGFEGRVLVRGSSASEFATKCAALEAAFTTPNGTLVIAQESQTLKTFGHSANTGYLGRPSFSKVGGKEDSGRARLYEVSVRAQRPADLSGKSGLRVAEYELSTTFFGIRSYRVTGTYTASGSTAAKAQYDAAIATLLSALESALTGTWERMEKSVAWDDENKVARFTQTGFETGLRDGGYEIYTTQQGLRSYRVTGTYTAVGATGARATYLSAIATLLATFETALTGTWLRGATTSRIDQADKLCAFTQDAVETGLRDAVYMVDKAASGVRAYRVSGKYEKAGNDSASTVYAAAIGTVLSTFESALTGTWERLETRYTQDQTDTIVEFEWNGLEVVFNQSSGVLDNSAVKRQQLVVARRTVAPGDYQGARRPVQLVVAYSASIDKSVTTDLKGFWNGTIKPFLIAHARSFGDGSSVAVLESSPNFDSATNAIGAQLVVQVYEASIFSHVLETEDDTTFGIDLVGVWSGDPDAFAEFQGQRVRLRTITEDIGRLGTPSAPAAAGGGRQGGKIDALQTIISGPGAATAVGGGSGLTPQLPGVGLEEPGYRLLRTIQTSRPEVVGIAEDGSVQVAYERFVHFLQYRNPAKRGGGSSVGGKFDDGRIESGLGSNLSGALP